MNILNPWHRKDGPYSCKFYTLSQHDKLLTSHRGVDVYQWDCDSALYILGDCAITHRAKFVKHENSARIIDEILDGKTPVADGVCEHLTKLGHKPLSYANAL